MRTSNCPPVGMACTPLSRRFRKTWCIWLRTKVTVGTEALSFSASEPFNTIASAKRLLGRGRADLDDVPADQRYDFAPDDGGMVRLQTAAGVISPVQVSAEILKVLSDRGAATLGGRPRWSGKHPKSRPGTAIGMSCPMSTDGPMTTACPAQRRTSFRRIIR